jgi:hypothetical protein
LKEKIIGNGSDGISDNKNLNCAMFRRVLRMFFLLLISFGNGFEGHTQHFKGGLIGGLTSSDVIGIDPYDIDFYKFSFHTGGFVHMAIGAGRFQVELIYNRKGSYQPPDVQNNLYSFYRLKLNYIEMPFVYAQRLHFAGKSGSIDNFEVEAGAYFAVLLSAQHENEYGLFNDRPFHTTDSGLLVGASYYFSPKWAFNLRLSNSVVPIRSHLSNTSYWLNSGEYNTAINYSLRYFIK